MTPTCRVGSLFWNPDSAIEEILPSLIPRIKLESAKDTIKYLSRSSPIFAGRVIARTGFKGIGLVAISITVKPWVSCLSVPWLPLPQVR